MKKDIIILIKLNHYLNNKRHIDRIKNKINHNFK